MDSLSILDFSFVQVDDWAFLVPQVDPAGQTGASFKKNRATRQLYFAGSYVPAELKAYFEERGILYKPQSQGKYPAGFAAPATSKNLEVMRAWPEIVRKIKLARAEADFRRSAHLALFGSCAWSGKQKCKHGFYPQFTKTGGYIPGFFDRIRYLDPATKAEEVSSLLSFVQLLVEKLGGKSDHRSWLEEFIAKKAAGIKWMNTNLAGHKCFVSKCNGRYEKINSIGKVNTYRCTICGDIRKRKLVKKRKGESIGKTQQHKHVWGPSACRCHKFMCVDPTCSAKANTKEG